MLEDVPRNGGHTSVDLDFSHCRHLVNESMKHPSVSRLHDVTTIALRPMSSDIVVLKQVHCNTNSRVHDG
jgi:hypothetical protein